MRGIEVVVGSLTAWMVLAGCDGVFGLQHVDPLDDGRLIDGPRIDVPVPRDTSCGTSTANPVSKLFGGRPNGVVPGGVADTFLSNDTAHLTSNFGALDRIFLCLQCSCTTDCESITGGDDDVVSLLRFDFGSEIPVCSMVQTATLYLYTTSDNLGSGSSILIYEVLEDWDEGTSAVATGTTGTASWIQRKPSMAWASAGAGAPNSRGMSILAVFSPNSGETDYTVTLDPAVVQRWVDNPAMNHGLVLTITGSSSDVHFYSRQTATDTKRPALSVTYRPPP